MNITVDLTVILRPLIFAFVLPLSLFLKAIQNPSDEALQEQAWAAVVPLVGKLKKFYEFSQRLGRKPCRNPSSLLPDL